MEMTVGEPDCETLKLTDPCSLWYNLCQYQIPHYLKFLMLHHFPLPSVCLDLATPTMVISQVGVK